MNKIYKYVEAHPVPKGVHTSDCGKKVKENLGDRRHAIISSNTQKERECLEENIFGKYFSRRNGMVSREKGSDFRCVEMRY